MNNSLGFLNTCEQFHLNCQVRKITKQWEHPITKLPYTSNTISLVPVPSTQQMLFYSAHMPQNVYKIGYRDGVPYETNEPDGFQMWARFPHPFAHYGRVSLCRANQWCDKTHLHVMNSTAEELCSTAGRSLLDRLLFRGQMVNDLVVFPMLLEELTEEQMITLERASGLVE
jgi:hypothetical protein